MSKESTNNQLAYADEWITHFKGKSAHNKLESLWCFRLIMFCSISAPMFLALGETFIFSKVIPSALSGVAAFCTAWLQLRKPQILWTTYKTAQRQLEVLRAKYQFKVEEFSDIPDTEADKLLIKYTTDIISKTNMTWSSQVIEYTPAQNKKIK
ncbi:DUF4231 domain-containing protein [Photobacterium gaetbulicola]|uniref:DUF4231 domain-containing protein n=1 Tax=Photobacterium gaetbulicola TaxID=1295392 RepID=UPI0005CC1674|nr:DUF4231 domain-containing protein [Photobacterium gaetbulicola]PSU13768.1 DUF4231 domain-containing protein [Photobacterium gaetbulicola]